MTPKDESVSLDSQLELIHEGSNKLEASLASHSGAHGNLLHVQPQDPSNASESDDSIDKTISEKSSEKIDAAVLTGEPLVNADNEDS